MTQSINNRKWVQHNTRDELKKGALVCDLVLSYKNLGVHCTLYSNMYLIILHVILKLHSIKTLMQGQLAMAQQQTHNYFHPK